MNIVLGIDLGLSSARAAVVDSRGRLLGTGRSETPKRKRQSGPSSRLPKAWLAAAIAASRKALANADRPRIDAIGIGAFGPCPVLLDARSRALTAAAMFEFNFESERHRQRLIEKHRIPRHLLGPDNMVAQLLWWREWHPDAFSRAVQVSDVTGFLVASLTGRAVIDPITLNDYHCPGLTLPIALPELVPADAMAGGLAPKMASKLGLPAGTPVTAGTYDSHVDIAATGATRAGQAAILLGSTIVMGMIVPETFGSAAAIKRGLRLTPHVGRGWFLGGWTSSSGSLIDWANGLVGRLPPLPPKPLSEPGVIVLPYFSGERAPVWDSLARGVILGASLSTTPDDIQRATIDGVALSTFDIAQRLYQTDGRKTRMRAAGGGLRNSLWAQATADALGCTLEAMAHAGESIGPAALAMRALGTRFEAGIAKLIKPDQRRHERYQRLFRIYSGLYPALHKSMHELGRMAERELKSA